jgi:hypothetical protein
MAHAQKPDFVFRAKRTSPFKSAGGVSSVDYWQPRCAASAVVTLDTPCSEVVWRALANHSIRQFPLHFPARASPCAITFQLDSTTLMPVMKQRFVHQLPNSYCSVTWTILHTASWYILQPPQHAEILVADRCLQMYVFPLETHIMNKVNPKCNTAGRSPMENLQCAVTMISIDPISQLQAIKLWQKILCRRLWTLYRQHRWCHST